MSCVNWIDELGNNVLHYACRGGSALLCEVLLVCGVNLFVRNRVSWWVGEWVC